MSLLDDAIRLGSKATNERDVAIERAEAAEVEVVELRSALDAAQEATRLANLEIERLRTALWIIEKWDSFPRVPDHDDPTKTTSFQFAYGSNGERDFMRAVARVALTRADAPKES